MAFVTAAPVLASAGVVAPTTKVLKSDFVSTGIRKELSGAAVAQPAASFQAARTFEVKAALPLIAYKPNCQNNRVAAIGQAISDEKAKDFSIEKTTNPDDLDEIVYAAYRQIFSEHQSIKYTKQPALESQFRNGEITVKDFIFGLVTSNAFLELNFQPNNNYRFAKIVIQRVLGRDVYSELECIAWSIVIVNEGVAGFVQALQDSQEYMENFGDFVVPFQRDRVLSGRAIGQTPFRLATPRYGTDWARKLGFPRAAETAIAKRAASTRVAAEEGSPFKWITVAKSLGYSIKQLRYVLPEIDGDYLKKVPSKKN
eukprot:tig00001095_g7030.t1